MFMQDIRQFNRAEAVLPSNPLVAPRRLPQAGIPGATPIETVTGWQPAETLRPGDRVATCDGGFRPLAALRAERLVAGAGAGMVRVPGGVLNNCRDVWLTPGQLVLIRSPYAAAVLDADSVLLPAVALLGYRGISLRAVPGALTLVALHFEEEELVFAASGLTLHCPTEGGPVPAGTFGYLPVLDAARGSDLMALIGAEAMTTAELSRAA